MASTTIGSAVRCQVPGGRPLSQPAGDKLQVPQPNVNVLRRPRVTELIQRAAAHRVTLVCGPAGAGKTVACATWAATSPTAGSVAWLSLGPGDREPDKLWGHLLAALSGTPAVPADLASDLAGAQTDDFPPRLVEAAERLTTPVTLVLDDIQELADSEVLPDVDFLIRHGPPALRLLLCGRHAAGFGVARLRVGGELAEIGAADLACTAQEADSYFAMLGIDIPAGERDELLARTQGWMTGLRLAALRAGQDAQAGRICAITGDDPAVADYLWDEVLGTQPAGRRLFLLRTSIAERICGELADTLTGETGGAAILDQLCRENLMVQAVTDVNGRDAAAGEVTAAGAEAGTGKAIAAGSGREVAEYRYHPLLRDLLRGQLRRELPDEVPLLARRAARWQAAHGSAAEAIRNAAQAGDWDLAARVLAEAGPAVGLPGPAAELEPVLALFPASRRGSDAAVATTLAAARLRAGDASAAAPHLDHASRALGRCSPGQRRAIGPWLQALRLTHASYQAPPDAGLIEQSMALARQAAEAASSAADHQALGLLWCAVGVAQLASRNVAAARGALGEASRHLTGGRREFSARARAWRAVAEALYGDLSAAGDLIADLRDDCAGAPDPLSMRLADLASAQVSWARDDAAAARGLLGKCTADAGPGQPDLAGQEARRSANPPAGQDGTGAGDDAVWIADPIAGQLTGWLADTIRARLSLGDADLAAARNLALRLRSRCLDPGASPDPAAAATADPALAVLDADIALRDGDPGRARLALARASGGPGFDRADLRIAGARVLLAEGDSRGALAAAGRCLDGTASQITLHDQISALVTASVAHRRLGQAELATDQLTRALVLAEPHGSYRPFLDGGPAVRSALTVLVRPASHGAALTARILQHFDTCPARAGDPSASATAPLTSSELAVLRFLPSHMTNQEIADALFLSINTVKTHLRSVYRKLGVSTRRQAISRAGRLGLL